jgi:hypothetical protein
MEVETNWLISRAMLMPLERMRLGISSDSASHTHTPGPTAKLATNRHMASATCQPWLVDGTATGGLFDAQRCTGSIGRIGERIQMQLAEERADHAVRLHRVGAAQAQHGQGRSSLRRLCTLVNGP